MHKQGFSCAACGIAPLVFLKRLDFTVMLCVCASLYFVSTIMLPSEVNGDTKLHILLLKLFTFKIFVVTLPLRLNTLFLSHAG